MVFNHKSDHFGFWISDDPLALAGGAQPRSRAAAQRLGSDDRNWR